MRSALINALVLILGGIYIFYESIRRILNPQMPDVKWMIGIAVVGIVPVSYTHLDVYKRQSPMPKPPTSCA